MKARSGRGETYGIVLADSSLVGRLKLESRHLGVFGNGMLPETFDIDTTASSAGMKYSICEDEALLHSSIPSHLATDDEPAKKAPL